MATGKWLPLESNPDMLTDFVRSLGVKAPARFIDIWAFDEESLGFFPKPIVAVCALYPSDEVEAKRRETIAPGAILPSDGTKCFYVRQKPDQHGNACGSIAIVHSVCNNTDKLQFEDGSPLLEFSRVHSGKDAEVLATGLQEATKLHSATSTVAAQGQTATPDAEDEVNHHFIAFVRSKEGKLLELDGMKPGPVDHGACGEDELLEKAIAVIRDDMMTKTSNMNFSVLALTTAPEDN